MRYLNTLTLSQIGGNRVSEDMKFKNSSGEDVPGPPTGTPPSAVGLATSCSATFRQLLRFSATF